MDARMRMPSTRGRVSNALVIAAFGVLSVVMPPAGKAHAAVKNFMAVLNGGQETPPTTSNSFGVAFLTFDTKTKQLCFSISFSPLAAAETVAHFHGPASPGEAGGILIDISPSPIPSGSPKNGCVGPLVKDAEKALKKGQVYINVHSATDTAGEIRGQVIPVAGK